MNEEENRPLSDEENFTNRFYILNACVTILLIAAIFISIHQFGVQAWQIRKQIALILPGEKNQLGWDSSQYLAFKSICDESDYELVVRENVPADYESCQKVADELSKRGVTAIAFTNGCLLSDIRKIEKEHPKINFFTIESISAFWSSGRATILSFEASYLAGILAGLQTKTNKIGYIAPFLEPEVNQSINAFTLGVQRVNPNAEILLNWTGDWNTPLNEEQAVQNLKAERVDVLTYHQNGDTIPNTARRAGIKFISFNETYPDNNYYLGAITIDWKKIYSDILKHKFGNEARGNTAYGIVQDVINLKVSDKVATREKVFVEAVKWELTHGRIIFCGDIFDRNGVQRCGANETMSFQNMDKNMNWLIRGVRIVGN